MMTFVTALYKLDERIYCTLEMYLNYFKPLADTGIHIHLFLQPKLYDEYIGNIGERSNIYITQLEFEDLPIYKQLCGVELDLPANRNIEKDTREFMILMNSKVEFVKRAIDQNIFNSTHFAWIDFGISKIIKKEDTLLKLKDIYLNRRSGVYMPTIQESGHTSFSYVCWRRRARSPFCTRDARILAPASFAKSASTFPAIR